MVCAVVFPRYAIGRKKNWYACSLLLQWLQIYPLMLDVYWNIIDNWQAIWIFGCAMLVAFSSGTVSLFSLRRRKVNGIREHLTYSHLVMREELICSHLNSLPYSLFWACLKSLNMVLSTQYRSSFLDVITYQNIRIIHYFTVC